MLASKRGKAIRFCVEDIRVFAGRTSTGVRGMKLAAGDDVISMSVLKHVDVSADERTAYLKAAAKARGADETDDVALTNDGEESTRDIQLSSDRFNELQMREQFLLTVSSKGFGKRSSAYEYRLTGRGGSGIVNMGLSAKNGDVVGTFPVTNDHQIMLVSDGGQLIRTGVRDVRITGRSAQGVTIFRVADDEKVISVAWLKEEEATEAEG